MSQQYCEWISDNVDERKLSDKSPIPDPDHQKFANMVAAQIASLQDLAGNLSRDRRLR